MTKETADTDSGVLATLRRKAKVFTFKKKTTMAVMCNRSEAAHVLHGLYDDFVTTNGLKDLHPDFHSLLTENARNPLPESSLKEDPADITFRGNRSQFGIIQYIRISNRPMYAVNTLTDWFNILYAPPLLLKAS